MIKEQAPTDGKRPRRDDRAAKEVRPMAMHLKKGAVEEVLGDLAAARATEKKAKKSRS
jgi:hypothetical protein